jgi:hypothetical protein
LLATPTRLLSSSLLFSPPLLISEGSSLYLHRCALQEALSAQALPLLENIYNSSGKKNSLHTILGFSLEAKQSTLPNAGNGLFLKGTALTGSVISFFPGTVHMREFLTTDDSMDKFLDDDWHNVISRYDDIVIDCRDYHGAKHPGNELAMAHYANHPPKDVKPNAFMLMYDFPAAMNPEHEDVIPHTFEKKPTLLGTIDKSAVHYGMVLMALRDIGDGEEIFLNYRFNPKVGGKPDWYHSVNLEEDEKRWSTER